MPTPKPSELLKDSLELLGDGKRWIKGVSKVVAGKPFRGILFPEGAYCMTGAIDAINTPNQNWAELYMAKAIMTVMPGFYSGYSNREIIQLFNDRPDTDWTDVKDIFNQSIQLAIMGDI